MRDVLAWLVDPADPAMRAQALVDLVGRPEEDPDVVAALKEIAFRRHRDAVSRRGRAKAAVEA